MTHPPSEAVEQTHLILQKHLFDVGEAQLATTVPAQRLECSYFIALD
jgi:hypothetical protein